MGGKSGGDPKMPVTRYYLSGHWGICQGPVDAIKAIWIGEKKAWQGNITENGVLRIAKGNLFGGVKKEGGVRGEVDIMLGGPAQVPPSSLVDRLGRPRSETPGFRGITSLLFRGRGSSNPDYDPGGLFGFAYFFSFLLRYKGFYWGTQPYLKPLWVTVQRIPAPQLDAATAPVPRGTTTVPTAVYIAIDLSNSMSVIGTNGKSRLENMKASLTGALQNLEPMITSGLFDIMVVGFAINTVTITRRSVDSTDLQDVIAWINARDFSDVENNQTHFDAAMSHATSFFQAAPGKTPISIFITDGLPSIPGQDWAGNAQAAADLLFETPGLSAYGINIDLSDTTYTAYLDNTEKDGIPVVTGGDPAELEDAFTNALIGVFDANPSHVVFECLTDTDWGMGAPVGDIDEASFRDAAQTLYDEGFGVFLQWTAQASIQDFIGDVLDHIKGAIFPHPRTGKTSIRLLRDDLDAETLKEITPDNAEMVNFSRKGWGETTNEIVVTWTNPETEKEETVRLQDLANIAQQGGVVSSSKNYHGVRTARLALQLAERDLREESAPLASCEVVVNREFWDTVPFDGVKVTWPEYGLSELVMRVMKVNYGDSQSSRITLSLVEDVFSLPLASYVPPASGEWADPGEYPVPVTAARLLPAPAYVASRVGVDLGALLSPSTLVVPVPANPTSDESARYDVLEERATASGSTSFEQASSDRPFPGTGEFSSAVPPAVTTTGVVLANRAGALPAVDDLLIVGGAAVADEDLELVLVTAVDDATEELTLLRGVLDTVPQSWAAGTPVTLMAADAWRPLPREYTDTQSLVLKFLTSTSTGMLEEYEAPAYTGTAFTRPSKPTRAANVQISGIGLDAPAAPLPIADTVVTWSHRNRLLEDAAMYAWDLASLAPEAGTTYTVRLYDENDALVAQGIDLTGETWTYPLVDELTLGFAEQPYSGIFDYSGTLPVPSARASSTLRVTLETQRDGEAAWQRFDHTLGRDGYGYGYGNYYGGT